MASLMHVFICYIITYERPNDIYQKIYFENLCRHRLAHLQWAVFDA